MDRFLSALIFLRRAKRKLGQDVDLTTLAANQYVDRLNRALGVDSREESFGQRLRLAHEGGNLCLWGPERFFSVVPKARFTYALLG